MATGRPNNPLTWTRQAANEKPGKLMSWPSVIGRCHQGIGSEVTMALLAIRAGQEGLTLLS